MPACHAGGTLRAGPALNLATTLTSGSSARVKVVAKRLRTPPPSNDMTRETVQVFPDRRGGNPDETVIWLCILHLCRWQGVNFMARGRSWSKVSKASGGSSDGVATASTDGLHTSGPAVSQRRQQIAISLPVTDCQRRSQLIVVGERVPLSLGTYSESFLRESYGVGCWRPEYCSPSTCVALDVTTSGLKPIEAYDYWRETVFYGMPEGLNWVGYDHEAAGRDMTRYVITLRHRHIAVVGFPRGNPVSAAH